jgi:hypothetical protein
MQILMVLGTRDAHKGGEAVDEEVRKVKIRRGRALNYFFEEVRKVKIRRGRALNYFFSASLLGLATERTRLELENRNGIGFVSDRGTSQKTREEANGCLERH